MDYPELQLNVARYKLLLQTYKTEDLVTCIALLQAKRFRSNFRRIMATQLRNWLANPDSNFPFTIHQLSLLSPTWPVKNIIIPKLHEQSISDTQDTADSNRIQSFVGQTPL